MSKLYGGSGTGKLSGGSGTDTFIFKIDHPPIDAGMTGQSVRLL